MIARPLTHYFIKYLCKIVIFLDFFLTSLLRATICSDKKMSIFFCMFLSEKTADLKKIKAKSCQWAILSWIICTKKMWRWKIHACASVWPLVICCLSHLRDEKSPSVMMSEGGWRADGCLSAAFDIFSHYILFTTSKTRAAADYQAGTIWELFLALILFMCCCILGYKDNKVCRSSHIIYNSFISYFNSHSDPEWKVLTLKRDAPVRHLTMNSHCVNLRSLVKTENLQWALGPPSSRKCQVHKEVKYSMWGVKSSPANLSDWRGRSALQTDLSEIHVLFCFSSYESSISISLHHFQSPCLVIYFHTVKTWIAST